jgi:hypothetical protein
MDFMDLMDVRKPLKLAQKEWNFPLRAQRSLYTIFSLNFTPRAFNLG